jgi:multidrug efflux pump subunit AcrA (membrane-fusion protein)
MRGNSAMNSKLVAIIPTIVLVGVGTSLSGCGGEHIPPPQLVQARSEYATAKGGIALQLDPTDVHEADLALQRATAAWNDNPDDPNTIDLCVIAQRKAQIAEAEAAAIKAQQDTDATKRELQGVVASQLQAARGQLDQTKQALSQTKQVLNTTQEQLNTEKALTAEQRQKLEAKLKAARDTRA